MKEFEAHCTDTGVSSEDREAWLRARRLGVGGSDAAVILGLSPYKSPLELFAEKVATSAPSAEEAEFLLWGREFEAPILGQYAKRSARAVARGGQLLRSRAHPFMTATLDASQERNDNRDWAGGPGVVEVKTTHDGKSFEAELPLHVQVQVQHELIVTGASWGTCVWLPFPERRMQWRDVYAHPGFQELLIEECSVFWDLVKRRTPPDPDRSASSKRALSMLYPQLEETALLLEEGPCWADAYAEVSNDLKSGEALKDELSNRIKATMGASKYLLVGDGRYFDRASVPAKDEECPHCAAVIGHRKAYTSVTLRQPRKKPLPDPRETRRLCEARDDLAAQLQESLTKREDT